MVLTVEPASTTPPPRSVFVGDAKSGTIWTPKEWRHIVGGFHTKGTLLRVYDAGGIVRHGDGITAQRPIPFSCLCFSREMTPPPEPVESARGRLPVNYAFVLAAVDQRGHVFVLDFVKNKFWLVARSGVSGSCIVFNSVRRREIFVGLSDNSLHCYNIDTCQLIAKLPAYHSSEPHQLSVHPTQPLALSTSATESILWDTEKWERKRLLVGTPSGVQQASFSPDGHNIITSFADGTMLIWATDTFTLQWKITLDQITGTAPGEREVETKTLSAFRNSYFTSSASGELLAYGGLGSTVYVWNLVEKRLMHEILIPSFENKLISQIEFIGSTNIVAVLSNTGDLIFLEAADARFVGQLEGRHKFKSFAISPDGRLLSTILLDAKYLINMLRLDPVLEPGAKNEEVIPSEETSEVAEKLTSPVEEPVTEKVPRKRISLAAPKPVTFFELVEMKEETSSLNRVRLRRFLHHYGKYPDEWRTLIWRFLLKLPENRESYEALLDQGMHPSVKDFRKKFPLKSDRLAKSMERVLSALAYWSPIFENLEYLPSLVFPFVKLFIGDMFSGLEVVMTVLANWCQKWWEYYPNPPIECLDIIEDLLGYHDSELLGHLVQHKVTSQVYAWLPLRALFSELFSKNDWLQIWDHFVTAPPSFAYYFLVAYLIGHRVALLDCKKKEEFKHFFQRRTPTANVSHVIQSAYHLAATTPSTVSPSTFLAPFRPLLKGEYPLFNQYPEFIVNYQSKMKERIRKDEEECLRKRKVADEVSRLTEELRKDRRAWESADWKMNDMVEKWWEQMMGEEETHAERKARLDAMEKEQRARAMREIAEARRSFVSHKKSTTQSHLSHLSKAVGTNQRSVDVEADRTALDVKFAEVEDEWTKRGEEMRKARERVVEMERNRVERLVRNAKRVGVRDDEIDEQVRRRIFGAGKGKERARTPAEGESRVPSPEKRGGTEDVREESPKSPNQDPGGPSNVHIGTDQVPAGGGEGRRGSPW